MAIVTNKLRLLIAKAFVEKLDSLYPSSSGTHNLYFFIGHSKPWVDPTANPGILGSKVISPYAGYNADELRLDFNDFSTIPVNSTIKNLDTGEVRQIIYKDLVDSQKVQLNQPVSIPWSTFNWAWKDPSQGFVWNDDNNPPLATGSQVNILDSAVTMLALKKLNSANIEDNASYVIPRFDYPENTNLPSLGGVNYVYAAYDDKDGNLLNHVTQDDIDAAHAFNTTEPLAGGALGEIDNQYTPGPYTILVREANNYHVFKCLDNGGPEPDPRYSLRHRISRVVPSKSIAMLDPDYIHSCSDGYKWKYMYTLNGDQVLKFLSDSWIPVRLALTNSGVSQEEIDQFNVQQAAKSGSIDVIRIMQQSYTTPVIFYKNGYTGGALDSDPQPLLPTQVRLPLDASINDNYYNGCELYFFGSGNKYFITSYDGGTQTATLSSATDALLERIPNALICIAPKIEIDGYFETGGNAASARVIVNNSGFVSEIAMLDKGLNYRVARALITTGVAPYEVPCPGLIVNPCIAPLTGHGSNAVDELGGYYVMINAQFQNQEGEQNADKSRDFMYGNDYRVIGLVRNVLDPTDAYATSDTLIAVKSLQLKENATAPTDGVFSPDELIECSNGARAYVIQHIPQYLDTNVDPAVIVPGVISFFQDIDSGFESFASDATITGVYSGVTSVILAVEDCEIKHYSGDILYIEQRKPINRAAEQTEDIKIVVEF